VQVATRFVESNWAAAPEPVQQMHACARWLWQRTASALVPLVPLEPDVPPELDVPAGRLPTTQVPPLHTWFDGQSSFSSHAPAFVDEHAIAIESAKTTIPRLPSQFDFMGRLPFSGRRT
jgi:hypothetical protein